MTSGPSTGCDRSRRACSVGRPSAAWRGHPRAPGPSRRARPRYSRSPGWALSLPSIASLLGIAVGTVRTQLGRAYAKTAVRSRAGATSALLDVVEPTALEDARRGLVAGELSPLTGRERTVLRIAATGRTTSSIASVIGISTETTKTHLANVYRKLGVQNRSQALLLVGATEDRRTLA